MKRIKTWLFATFLFLSGCATQQERGVTLHERNYPLTEIKAAIVSISGEPRSVSDNKREFISQYFTRRKETNFDPQKSKERLYAIFTVFGDRRPYDIRVEVVVERRSGSSYEEYSADDQMARKIATELKTRLNQGRDGRSVIDEFRPF